MADGDFTDLTRRTTSDKILHNNTVNIAKNYKYDGYQRGLVSMVQNIFDKKDFCCTCTVRDLRYAK